MKKQDLTQNVIVELDFNKLNKFLRQEDEKHKLLGYNGYISSDISYIDDQIILHRFAWLKGTMDAIELLGKILDSIDCSLKYIYYFKYNDKLFECNGTIPDDISEFDCYNINVMIPVDENNNPEYSKDEETEMMNIVYENRQEILTEAHRMKKYYKEYYTRLFDRGRTVK